MGETPMPRGTRMNVRRVYLLSAVAIFLLVVFAAVVATSNQAYRVISYQSAPHRYWIVNSCSGLLFFSVQTGVRRDPDFRSAAFDFTGGYYPEGNSNGWAVTTVAIPY